MITDPSKTSPKRYLELDALRGFAAMFVMLFHYTQGKVSTKFFALGVTGVDLFFLISGFVIFMSINHVASGREFVINRVARLYPTYWACVSITFGVMVFLRMIHFNAVHDSNAGVANYLGNLTMFQYYLHIKDLDVPYWTMIIEMLFYLLILALYQLKWLKHIITIGCLFNILILVNYALVVRVVIPNYNVYFPLVNHFALFFGGIVFYKIATQSISIPAGYSMLVFCLITQITVYRFAGSDPDHISQLQYFGVLLLYFTLFVLFINEKLRFIISAPAVFLGKISFALYLIHSYIFRGVIGFAEKRFHLPFWIATLLIAIPAAILLAYLITAFIEKPLGKKLKSMLNASLNTRHPIKN
ncbi:acyltransferase family protein [Mucilaginibacter glaciei]|uniref:Acyltransferase n=1 Tax=Mucilaginibacter glaciei TaxID=2772109 RepID=A0A926NSB4_9SPHI|nr:acyltransferase [Mucilaginibacter glaciei]MBD1393712.1 acyltransferase [Mucilaginibacter glaciei]